MPEVSVTPSIPVTIGRQARVYHAFVTTAPVYLDAPSTVTLYTSSLSDVAGFAANSIAFDRDRAQTPGRLVLINATELAWQRARYRGDQCLLAEADPILVGFNTLQHWLWQRLQTAG